MSSAAPGRLTALGWRSLRIQTRTIPRHSGSPAAAVVARRPATEPCRWNSSSFKRRGKAIEPATTPADTTVATDEVTPPVEQQQQQAAEPRVESTVKSIVKTDAPLKTEQTAEELKNSHAHKATGDSDQQADSFSSSSSSSSEVLSANKPATESTDTTDRTPKQEAGGPLDKVLSDVQPNKGPTSRSGRYHPHMSPPPYVHHFDSYSLVKQLQDGGYTPTQAIEAMKGIRALLAQNLDVAQDELVSKSDVENESYLFRAACSELGQEIRNNRRLQDEQIRQQRTLLQHEVDILTQSLNQEVSTLNDNVRGMFNDRRMAVREEQKTADSAVCTALTNSSTLADRS